MKSHNIKDILEERRMEVSEGSWDQLASQLDANDKKKKRRNIYPYAACLAILVGLITFIVSKNIGEIESQTIVNTDKETQIEKEVETPKPLILKDNIHTEITEEAVVVQEELPKVNETETRIQKEEIVKQQKESIVQFEKEVQKDVVVQEKEIIPKEIETIITQKDVVIDTDKDLRASIVALSAIENIEITDAEIDQMLKEAQLSLSELDIEKENDQIRFATADELLYEVENELDRSFKQKVFDLIKRNVKKGKTLLADRN